ncbi:hypothetical protein L596_012741 [Steinernema carpocapsae]|uniref:SANT domain-containing protein n=1 Tax=Steinernema carpocapsae TaxID=34508 RepID=A0A4U5NYW3_STECR|nr:hypothetical protein L596_012741 [Steinernema carpocapsae]
MEEERPASGEGDSVVESDMDSALEEEDMVEGETEAEETDEEGRKLGSGQLILTEIANDVIEAEDSRESNSSSSKSDEKKSDDDSRGRSKARDTPSPPMSRKRRIQDIQQADDGKRSSCSDAAPTDLEIREGKDFQALVPDYIEHGDEERATEAEKEICHWMPLEDAEAPKIDAYCNDCEAEFGLDRHQSLYMLQKTFYDYEKAKELCQKRTSLKEEWSAEDKNLFQHYLSVFGKNFSRIRTAMPHKSAAALIQHYYNTKKTQFTKSFFDVDHASHKEEEMYDESSDEDEG